MFVNADFFLHFSVGINVSSRASDRTAVSLVRKETSCCGNIQHHLFEGHFSRASLWGQMPRRHTIFKYISVACFTIKYNYGEQANKQRERGRERERECASFCCKNGEMFLFKEHVIPTLLIWDMCLSLSDLNLKILRDDSSCPGATQVIRWVKGCFDALDRKYVSVSFSTSCNS